MLVFFCIFVHAQYDVEIRKKKYDDGTFYTYSTHKDSRRVVEESKLGIVDNSMIRKYSLDVCVQAFSSPQIVKDTLWKYSEYGTHVSTIQISKTLKRYNTDLPTLTLELFSIDYLEKKPPWLMYLMIIIALIAWIRLCYLRNHHSTFSYARVFLLSMLFYAGVVFCFGSRDLGITYMLMAAAYLLSSVFSFSRADKDQFREYRNLGPRTVAASLGPGWILGICFVNYFTFDIFSHADIPHQSNLCSFITLGGLLVLYGVLYIIFKNKKTINKWIK